MPLLSISDLEALLLKGVEDVDRRFGIRADHRVNGFAAVHVDYSAARHYLLRVELKVSEL